ncbi:hypothetical protein [Chengkuizengella axinellae]|uniref:Ribbon-helix-helix protein, CopG family n=1 Tax=Chengkuizengella axinellae TaxID=3064388 RepID=A0ABT9J2C1_9BACL|nr:hypothetical protein [Chengkuizengella sp. 2205SS18-9]MDP5275638.1 hypothetical protein [Chengkuizengella sp. 2205SS18-9]
MNQITFSSYEELEQMLKEKFIKKAKFIGLSEEDIEQSITYKRKSKELWDKHNCQQIIEKHGTVTIEVWMDEEGNRRTKRGRPRKEESEKLNYPLHVRLDEESFSKLNDFAKELDVNFSTAIRMILKNL